MEKTVVACFKAQCSLLDEKSSNEISHTLNAASDVLEKAVEDMPPTEEHNSIQRVSCTAL